jgi:F0F1-type ATP synthase assembly protein I
MLLKSLQQLLFGILSGFFSDEFSPNSPCSIISMLMLQWHAY